MLSPVTPVIVAPPLSPPCHTGTHGGMPLNPGGPICLPAASQWLMSCAACPGVVAAPPAVVPAFVAPVVAPAAPLVAPLPDVPTVPVPDVPVAVFVPVPVAVALVPCGPATLPAAAVPVGPALAS